MRKLASIQKIIHIDPIEGADRIELATVLGWHVVVRKGEFRVGDLIVYCEIDSVLPDWLKEKINFTDKVLKTRRFRGVYSQGLCLPLSILQDMRVKKPFSHEEGTDLTDTIGIKKWEPDERNAKEEWWKKKRHHTPKIPLMRFAWFRWIWRRCFEKAVTKEFPTDVAYKTDETRVQVLQDVLDKYCGLNCECTEKIDGSSITVWLEWKDRFIFHTPVLHVASRNREILDADDFMFQAAARLFQNLKRLPRGIVLQGEIVGPNIQGNKYHLEDYYIYFYQASVKDMDGRKHFLPPQSFRTIIQNCGLQAVPYLGTMRIGRNIDYYIDMSRGISKLSNETPREGIVIRPLQNVIVGNDDRFVGGRLSFKAVNPDFLVKYKL